MAGSAVSVRGARRRIVLSGAGGRRRRCLTVSASDAPYRCPRSHHPVAALPPASAGGLSGLHSQLTGYPRASAALRNAVSWSAGTARWRSPIQWASLPVFRSVASRVAMGRPRIPGGGRVRCRGLRPWCRPKAGRRGGVRAEGLGEARRPPPCLSAAPLPGCSTPWSARPGRHPPAGGPSARVRTAPPSWSVRACTGNGGADGAKAATRLARR